MSSHVHELQPLHPSQYVTTTQPGVSVPSAPGYVWMPVPPAIQGVPVGLEYLTQLDTVFVHQIKEMLEIVTDWETNNKYALKNANGQQCYYAFEESGCCERQCCGPNRSFKIHIVDNFQREVLKISREFKCCAGCGYLAFCRCCQFECIIESPSMGLLGTVVQSPGYCSLQYNVLDADGRVVFKIGGPGCCTMAGCGDKKFKIKSPDDVYIGAITKKWGGFCREAFTDADTFAVTFPEDLDVKMKGVLLGATFLIDFMAFEAKQRLHGIQATEPKPD